MIKLFFNTTDNFLCNSIKSTFIKTETRHKNVETALDLKKELQNFQENPLGCTIGLTSKFETNIKQKIKLRLGVFFVLIPLVVFTLFSYLVDISITYGVVATLGIAFLVASRFEELSRRYVQARLLEF